MMLQRFRLIDHTRYQLRLKETLTIKPEGLKIKVRPRVHKTARRLRRSPKRRRGATAPRRPARRPPRRRRSCRCTARRCWCCSARTWARRRTRRAGSPISRPRKASTCASRGSTTSPASCRPTAACSSCARRTTARRPTTPRRSTNGCKTAWRPTRSPACSYAVFGCGNRNWASTYQAVPRFIDDKLAEFGAQRLFARGEGDAQEDLDGQFRAWRIALWQQVAKDFGVTFDARAETDSRPRYAIEVVAGPQANPLAAVHGANAMRVLANRELQTSRRALDAAHRGRAARRHDVRRRRSSRRRRGEPAGASSRA